ncbi:hypothetical protein BDV93DRAFT_509825 [Ceratobasidium sp. AG-I]|nr:hypothetical protein BDV93DRAFT_509825 [Ceratobasidium sp. AG-I]
MARPARTPAEREAQERQIADALKALSDGSYKSAHAAAVALGLNPKTLRDRWLGRRKDGISAQAPCRLLTPTQSDILDSWCIHLSWTGEPLSQTTIIPYVEALCGTQPSPSWVKRYLHDNPHLVFRRPTGLDPKRASTFNRATVERHFHLFKSTIALHDIPLENQYNMDEKGIQTGGGRRGTGEKFICGSR